MCRLAFDGCCPDCKMPGDDCPIVWGECSHPFHMHCIVKWINSQVAKRCRPCEHALFLTHALTRPLLPRASARRYALLLARAPTGSAVRCAVAIGSSRAAERLPASPAGPPARRSAGPRCAAPLPQGPAGPAGPSACRSSRLVRRGARGCTALPAAIRRARMRYGAVARELIALALTRQRRCSPCWAPLFLASPVSLKASSNSRA